VCVCVCMFENVCVNKWREIPPKKEGVLVMKWEFQKERMEG